MVYCANFSGGGDRLRRSKTMRKRSNLAWGAGLASMVAGVLLSACQGPTVQVPVTVLVPQTQPVTQVQIQVQTQVVTVPVPVTVTPIPTASVPKTLVVCLGQEPDSLA